MDVVGADRRPGSPGPTICLAGSCPGSDPASIVDHTFCPFVAPLSLMSHPPDRQAGSFQAFLPPSFGLTDTECLSPPLFLYPSLSAYLSLSVSLYVSLSAATLGVTSYLCQGGGFSSYKASRPPIRATRFWRTDRRWFWTPLVYFRKSRGFIDRRRLILSGKGASEAPSLPSLGATFGLSLDTPMIGGTTPI